MTDQIIKGTGNSRYLKSNISASATWSDFLSMLRNGTLPIDFNGINSAGINTPGTPLNKANLLSDETASALANWSGTTPDTVNEALSMLPKCARIQSGSYIGTGTYGSSNPCKITFDFAPVLVFGCNRYGNSAKEISQVHFGSNYNSSASFLGLVNMNYVPASSLYSGGASDKAIGFGIAGNNSGNGLFAKKSDDGKTLYWYSNENVNYQSNTKNYLFAWVAIG